MGCREFVVIASQRTGSTLLVRSLDTASHIFCAGEIFHPGPQTLHREFQYPYLRPGRNLLARVTAPLLQKGKVRRHLNHFFGTAGQGVQAVGFKLMVSQADRYPAILDWLRRRRAIAIVLQRQNTFDAALSYCMASLTGRYHSDRTIEVEKRDPVTISDADFGRYFQACARDRARLLDLHVSLGGMLLSYEDLVGDWDGSIARIGEHLDIRGLHVAKSLDKLSGPAKALIANEDALRARFQGFFA
jgi:LPS sulfotransferase NodH